MDQESKNKDFGIELENLLEKYPKSKVFGALVVAVRNLKNGNPAKMLIRGDWDKYGECFDPFGKFGLKGFSEELKELIIKYGLMDQNGKWVI